MTLHAEPPISTIECGNFTSAAQGLGGEPWTMQQAWLAAPEKILRPAAVHFGWEPSALWILAELSDDFITSRSTDHDQEMWRLGDVFEIFVARKGSPFYLELHVTPRNHRLHLCLPNDGLEKIRTGQATLDDFRCPPSAFDSWVMQSPEKNQWQVLARIPASILPDGESFTADEILELSFSRYDAGPDGAPDVLSSTSPHHELNFHRRHEWREVVLTNA
jgi:hypothetical protein